jgi:integrase
MPAEAWFRRRNPGHADTGAMGADQLLAARRAPEASPVRRRPRRRRDLRRGRQERRIKVRAAAPPTVACSARHLTRRDRYCPAPRSDRFFLSTTGTALLAGSIEGLFTRVLSRAGITAPPGQRCPRLHDLRHRFAVATLVDWYRQDLDVQACLPLLSTMLGHVAPISTYWYLTATPELLTLAARRMEDHLGVLP